jgi:hypothetical protein
VLSTCFSTAFPRKLSFSLKLHIFLMRYISFIDALYRASVGSRGVAEMRLSEGASSLDKSMRKACDNAGTVGQSIEVFG